jgi:hypothetical protein
MNVVYYDDLLGVTRSRFLIFNKRIITQLDCQFWISVHKSLQEGSSSYVLCYRFCVNMLVSQIWKRIMVMQKIEYFICVLQNYIVWTEIQGPHSDARVSP